MPVGEEGAPALRGAVGRAQQAGAGRGPPPSCWEAREDLERLCEEEAIPAAPGLVPTWTPRPPGAVSCSPGGPAERELESVLGPESPETGNDTTRLCNLLLHIFPPPGDSLSRGAAAGVPRGVSATGGRGTAGKAQCSEESKGCPAVKV